MKLFFIFAACLCMTSLGFAQSRFSVVNNTVLEPVNLSGVAQLQAANLASGSGQYLCTLNQRADLKWGVYSFDGVNDPVLLLLQDELPSGFQLYYNGQVGYGCVGNTVYVLGYNPSQLVGTAPTVNMYSKAAGGGVQPILERNTTTYAAVNPRNNQSMTYTVLQTLSMRVIGNRVTALVQAQPGSPSSEPSQFAALDYVNGQWQMVFDFSSVKNVSYIGSAYCATNTAVYTTLKSSSQAGVDLYRTVGSTSTMVLPNLLLSGVGLACLPSGVMLSSYSTSATPTTFTYGYLDDNASSLSTLLSSSFVNDTSLSTYDLMWPYSQTGLYITASGALLQVTGSGAQTLKLSSQSPTGSAQAVTVVAGRPYYLQSGLVFRLYQPSLTQTSFNVPAGGAFTLQPQDTQVVASSLPTPKFTGWTPSFTVSSDGLIQVTVPAGTQPGTYNGSVNIPVGSSTISLPFTVTVPNPGPPKPVVTAVVNATFAANKAALVPGMLATVFFTGSQGSQGQAGVTAEFKTGGVAATMCGIAMRTLYNTGTGQLNAMVPTGITAGTTSCPIVLTVDTSSNPVQSDATNVPLTSVYNSFFQHQGQDGSGNTIQYPDFTDSKGNWIGIASAPATRGQVYTGWGTGCGPLPGLADNQNASAATQCVQTPVVKIGGVAAHVLYAGAAPNFVPGLQQYNIEIPAGAPAGLAQVTFGDDPNGPSYPIYLQ
jgi:uncharacterized protein (TIGR03437 family)